MPCSGLTKMDFHVSPRGERWLGLLVGSLTGAITTATGVFVLPGTPYVQSLEFDRHKLVQTLGLSFTVSTITLGAALAMPARSIRHLRCPSVVALGAALVGMWLGQIVRGRVKAEDFPVVLLHRPARARRASGAARPAVMD